MAKVVEAMGSSQELIGVKLLQRAGAKSKSAGDKEILGKMAEHFIHPVAEDQEIQLWIWKGLILERRFQSEHYSQLTQAFDLSLDYVNPDHFLPDFNAELIQGHMNQSD